MGPWLIPLIVFVVIITSTLLIIAIIKLKTSAFLQKYFGTSDLKDAIEKSEIAAQETPKSLSSMENVTLNSIRTDFPDLDIKELKSLVEKSIRNVFLAIEEKDTKRFEDSEYLQSFINSKIEDSKGQKVSYDNLNFHNTVVNYYEKKLGTACITFQTAFEYYKKVGDNIGKKIQDRVKVEYIYIMDDTKFEKTVKGTAFNCPNCGAPVSNLGHKTCSYCGVAVETITKKTWYLNKIIQN